VGEDGFSLLWRLAFSDARYPLAMRLSRLAIPAIVAGLGFLFAVLLRMDSLTGQLDSANPRTGSYVTEDASEGATRPNKPTLVPRGGLLPVDAEPRRSVIAGPRGRVLECGTDRPIEGLSVQLKSGGKIHAGTVTAADGAFSFSRPDRSRSAVEIVTDEWRITPRKYRLDEDQSRGAADLVFRAERIVAEPLRGVLLDRRTGEPVPEFLIRAKGPRGEAKSLEVEGDPNMGDPTVTFEFRSPPRRFENIVTGKDGRFESAGGFEAGVLDVVLVDHPSLLNKTTSSQEGKRTIEHKHVFDEASPSEDIEIKVAIGPTYRLDVALPGEMSVDDFYATFPLPSSGLRGLHRPVAGDPSSPMALLYGRVTTPNALEQEAPLRKGEPVWARFPEPVLTIQEVAGNEGDQRLHVRSRDGHWSGSAPVSSIVGIYAEVVPISLEARGAVEGTVLEAGGNAVPTAWIQLVTAPASLSPIEEVGADAKGRFEFKWLTEGDYDVVVHTDRYEESRSAISIVNGATENLEIRLAAGLSLGTISGLLRSRTGQHRSKGGVVTLKGLEDPSFFLFKTVSYQKRKGEYTAEFSFENVPSGNYEVSLEPLDNMRWETRTIMVSPPADGIEFICEDDAPTFDLGFRAIDAQTGRPIERSWNIVWQGNPLDDVRLDDDWKTGLYKDIPEGVSLQWILRAEGYRLATGDEMDIRTEADHRVVEARLDRGWGQVFKITTREREPIEGVELIVDGSSIGMTDAQGMISMNLDGKPRFLEFRYKDWFVTWGRVDPDEDGFGWGPETLVYLDRDH
jgi:hypothetical protein